MSARRRGARLLQALRERRVIVVCGSGGVGKTTTAAALGLQAALEGRSVLVCTVDPSPRLATSLGLRQLSERPRELSLARLSGDPAGRLWAMALDVQRTFDTLVERYAPDPAARRRILDNRFYRQISAALAGSHEYMAMEKLLELSADPRFDLIVLDTPPTRHALDFLEAPERLMGFLDAGVLRFFLKPYFVAGRLTLKVASRTGALALRIADAVLGLQFLQDLSEFFLAFESMYAGFKERAQRVFELLRDRRSGFVLVAAPARLALDEGLYFYRRLAEKEMPFVSFVVNRVHPEPASSGPGRRRSSPARPLDPALGAALLQVYDDQRTLARLDQRNVARLAASTREDVIVVPEFEADVHDLRGLLEFGAAIFGLRSPGLARSRGATAPALESAPR